MQRGRPSLHSTDRQNCRRSRNQMKRDSVGRTCANRAHPFIHQFLPFTSSFMLLHFQCKVFRYRLAPSFFKDTDGITFQWNSCDAWKEISIQTLPNVMYNALDLSSSDRIPCISSTREVGSSKSPPRHRSTTCDVRRMIFVLIKHRIENGTTSIGSHDLQDKYIIGKHTFPIRS